MSIAFSLSIFSVSSISIANETYQEDRIHVLNGKEYRETPGDVKIEENAVTNKFDDQKAKEYTALINDRTKLRDYLLLNHSDQFGGTYTDKNGNNVILLTDDSSTIKKNILDLSDIPEKTKIVKVKYSKKELTESKKRIVNLIEKYGIGGVGMNSSINKVNIYISEEKLTANKQEILKHINEDMVNWVLGDIKTDELAYDLYPGEKINYDGYGLGGFCSLGFNATSFGGAKVGVTAGHCGNRTWYDASDGTSSIGTMSNATNSNDSLYDAGYINYVSAVTPRAVLNSNTLTIGTFDYNGSRQEFGDFVYLHATSGNGSSYGPLMILDESFYDPTSTNDVILTENSTSAAGGDSGGLFYSLINNGTKNYAVVEGVFKGPTTIGSNQYLNFSKVKNIYDGLNLGSVYVDPTY